MPAVRPTGGGHIIVIGHVYGGGLTERNVCGSDRLVRRRASPPRASQGAEQPAGRALLEGHSSGGGRETTAGERDVVAHEATIGGGLNLSYGCVCGSRLMGMQLCKHCCLACLLLCKILLLQVWKYQARQMKNSQICVQCREWRADNATSLANGSTPGATVPIAADACRLPVTSVSWGRRIARGMRSAGHPARPAGGPIAESRFRRHGCRRFPPSCRWLSRSCRFR